MLVCAMNLQYCTLHLILRYLAKYLGSLDKASKIVISSRGRPDAENTLKVHEENANNTKITGNLIRERRLASMKKNKNFELLGRDLSLLEVFMQFFRYPTIITTHRYEFCPTQPMAERPIIKKKPYVHKLKPRN
jgi:hypothetical protein